MTTGYKIRHLATGTLSSTPYTTMTAASLALIEAAPHSSSEFDVVPVVVCDHPRPDLLSPCCYRLMDRDGAICPSCHQHCVPELWCFDCDEVVSRA